ncbi:MAG: HdeD family acid-resistance protein [Deltaproteobacteria bacterium]|nr:HdeD family acid-resistance protein [Deltaproteobacteria bacterium]
MRGNSERLFAIEFIPATLDRDHDASRRSGPLMIGLGALLVLVGAAACIQFPTATIASVYLVGACMIVGGCMFGIGAFVARRWNIALLDVLAAAVYIVVGSFILRQPIAAATGITLMLSIIFMVQGVVRILAAIAMLPSHWPWLLISGIATFALGGMIMLGWPASGLWVLGTLIGIDILVSGITMIALGAAAMRAAGRHIGSKPSMPRPI